MRRKAAMEMEKLISLVLLVTVLVVCYFVFIQPLAKQGGGVTTYSQCENTLNGKCFADKQDSPYYCTDETSTGNCPSATPYCCRTIA